MIGRLIPVVVGWIIWRKTGNIIIGALVAVFLEALAGPLLKELSLLFVKTPEIKALDGRPAMTDGKGLRILIGKKQDSTLTPEEIREQGQQALADKPKFTGLLQYVREHDLPVQTFLWEYSKKTEQSMIKAFRVWGKMEDVHQIVGDKVNDDYFYTYDAPDQLWFVVFAFDTGLPLPEVPPEGAEAEKKPEDAPAGAD